MPDIPRLHCAVCGRGPAETHGEFVPPGRTADAYVLNEEGTLDDATGAYLCDEDYILAGMPVGRDGRRWIASPANLRALGLDA